MEKDIEVERVQALLGEDYVVTRQWATQYRTKHFGLRTAEMDSEDAAKQYAKDLADPKFANYDPDANPQVISRLDIHSTWTAA